MNTEQTQEGQNPTDEQGQQPTSQLTGISEAIETISKVIIEAMAEVLHDGQERDEFLKSELAPKSHSRFLIESAFTAGVNWSISLPPLFVVAEYRKLRKARIVKKASDIETIMQSVLQQRPDEVEEPDGN